MKNLFFIAFLVISNSLFGQGIDITVTGGWVNNISPSDISEAGNDYPTPYTSTINQTLLTIIPKNYKKLIYVYVTRSDIAWHNNLTLKIRRTSNGTNNNNTINGGLLYQTITSAPSPVTTLFTCEGPFINLSFQYEITGISVVLPVQSYATTIMYTVMH
jgi:hypothetical protein